MDDNPHTMAEDRKRPRLAAASAVLGALSFAAALAAAVTAVTASRLYSPDPLRHWLSVGTAYAFIAAVAFGLLAMAVGAVARGGGRVGLLGLVCAVVAAILLPAWTRKPEAEWKVQCLSNIKHLGLSVAMYASDWGRYPEAARWSDAILPYVQSGIEMREYGPGIAPHGPASEETMRRVGQTYRCPDAAAACAYAYNAALSQLAASGLAAPDKVIALYESDRGWNAHGGKDLLPASPRHFGGDNIAFADGSARWCARRKPPGEVRWNTVWPREYQSKSAVQWQPALKRAVK